MCDYIQIFDSSTNDTMPSPNDYLISPNSSTSPTSTSSNDANDINAPIVILPDPIGSARPSTSRASQIRSNGTNALTLAYSGASGSSLPSTFNQNTNGTAYSTQNGSSLPSVFNMDPNGLAIVTPIGSSLPFSSNSNAMSASTYAHYYCNLHNEIFDSVCLSCKKMVCQCCTLHEHKDHAYEPLQKFIAEAHDHINNALEMSAQGNIHIRQCIDVVVAYIRDADRNCAEVTEAVRKIFREFIMSVEDRERILLESLDRAHHRVSFDLDGQMAGYKSTLKGVAETAEMFGKLKQTMNINSFDLVKRILEGQRQLDQFAVTANDLTPKKETFVFIKPDDCMLQDVRMMGDVHLFEKKTNGVSVNNSINGAGVRTIRSTTPIAVPNNNMRRNSYNPRGNSYHSNQVRASGWEFYKYCKSQSLKLQRGSPRLTQAIPGSAEYVRARLSTSLSSSFATEGHRDGQVSRPWGLCVNKLGNILISDRRNNRVQVFHMDGSFLFNFGRKGVGNGEFDLPAGICVDSDDRIIVVDKDNHRVQIFTSSGVFLSKFGSYGKEYGQFQYPWDVAVNHRLQIAVTDSRNHRIQQFDSEGRFIRQILFDNYPLNKGITSPRGICYTPTGNIIVTDFDNHCLYLIDPDINEILAVQGREGSKYNEFNRPSGVCCDDDGRIIVADSKNKRIVVFTPNMEFLWIIEVRPCMGFATPGTFDEKDRTCDVAVMPDGRIAFLIELSPDSKEGFNPTKRFVHLF